MKKISFNKIFTVICLLVLFVILLFIFSPLLLNCSFINKIISCFLDSLKIGAYKISYIESIGSLLGTFLAVLAALLTQKFFEKSADIKETKISATIVYFDFKFAFKQLMDMCIIYQDTQSRKENDLLSIDFKWYEELRKRFTLSIDKKWIQNVAKLSNSLSESEIQKIYEIYGDLEAFKTAFSHNLDENEMNDLVSLFCNRYYIETKSPRLENLENYLEENTKQLMYKLKKFISVDEDKLNF